MLIFIDESGDAGFKFQKGSSKYFVVCLVLFDDEREAEKTSNEIYKLQMKLNKRLYFEFKFNKLSKKIRLKFLETVKDSNFSIRAVVFNKQNISDHFIQRNKNNFYNYAVKVLLKRSQEKLFDAKIRIDGLNEQVLNRTLST
jgi:hypothetical protein